MGKFHCLMDLHILMFASILKRVMPSNDEVINGERNYRDIYQYFEDNKSCTLMQHEAYPFIEIFRP